MRQRPAPDWEFVLIGSTFGCDTSEARKFPNIKFLGEVEYDSLPGYLYAFDVCMIPFKITELTRCTNPVKIYEYLSAGKPVVATRLPELELLRDYCHIAGSPKEFADLLETALLETDDEALYLKRRDWAATQSWDHRVAELEKGLSSWEPKVSVIVLTYNNLDMTKACLHSIDTHSLYDNLEIVIVDNASTDGSQEFLKQFAEDRPDVLLVLNNENKGFAAGNNQGLDAATGDFMIVLNNDTFVTPGWVRGLVRPLLRDPSIGLAGPVTNNIGNEAKINIEYHDIAEMEERYMDYTSAHLRELYEADVAAFFCVAIPRAVYEDIGGLDESYGRGFFEDDDYCMRVRKAGYRIVIVDDVFVHHHLSASFSLLTEGERGRLFEENKKKYEAKWGPWVPHKYRWQKDDFIAKNPK